MRILLLNYEYPPLGGGAGVATAALAEALAEHGVAVDVVTAGASVTDPATARGCEEGCKGRLRVHRVRSRRTGIHEAGMLDAASYLWAALPLVRQLLKNHRYDVAHFFFSLPTGALLPFLDLRGTPVVVSLRGSDVPGYDPHNPGMQLAHRLLKPLTRWIWRRADRVVAVCESLGALTLRTAPSLRYAVVPNGVDLERFAPPRAGRGKGRRTIRCLAVARLIERKGLGDLIQAFARLERGRFELEIVGGGPDEAVLRELASRYGLGQEVRFQGVLDRAAVAQRYREADLFTLPSSAEAFGNVFAEALASGLPIVASNVGGIPELVEHGTNGLLVTPGDVEGLAGAIRYLAQDPELRREMAGRNRAKAESTLEWAHVTQRYIAIYQAIQPRFSARSMVAEPTASTG